MFVYVQRSFKWRKSAQLFTDRNMKQPVVIVCSWTVEGHSDVLGNQLRPAVRTARCGLSSSGACLQRDNGRPHTARHTFKQITYLLTWSMELNNSWEANRFSASQKITRILWNQKLYYHIHKCSSPVSILSQLDPAHTPHSTFCVSILILSSHLRLGLPSGLFPSGFPTKTLYTPLLFPIRATCPAHFILLAVKQIQNLKLEVSPYPQRSSHLAPQRFHLFWSPKRRPTWTSLQIGWRGSEFGAWLLAQQPRVLVWRSLCLGDGVQRVVSTTLGMNAIVMSVFLK